MMFGSVFLLFFRLGGGAEYSDAAVVDLSSPTLSELSLWVVSVASFSVCIGSSLLVWLVALLGCSIVL